MCGRTRGFSLIEVVVASAISAVLFLLVYNALDSSMETTEWLGENYQFRSQGGAVLERIASQLENSSSTSPGLSFGGGIAFRIPSTVGEETWTNYFRYWVESDGRLRAITPLSTDTLTLMTRCKSLTTSINGLLVNLVLVGNGPEVTLVSKNKTMITVSRTVVLPE